MELTNIFDTIRKERYDFLNNEITIVGGLTHSQYKTIQKNHLYYTSHFENGDYEVINGVTRKKHFHNINSWRCDVATKMLDIDFKDFLLVGNDPNQDVNVMLLEKELKHWMKREKWGKILNQVSEKLPVQGTCVLRKYGNDEAKVVDLRYLYNDQSAESLKTARYIIIRNLMDANELRKMKGKWNNVQDVLDNFDDYSAVVGYDNASEFGGNANIAITKNNTQNLVEVWERWGEFPKSWITGKSSDEDEYVWGKFIVCGADAVSRNENGKITAENGIVLWAEELNKDKDFPFKEVHYRKVDGRWLGVGIVEMTWEPQRRTNEIKNQEAKALELASLQLFQTRSTNVMSNVLTDADTGDIIQSNSEITPIATESRNLQGFQVAFDGEDKHADRLTFSYDGVSGETAPASATLGAQQIATQQATSAFDYKRENVALFYQEYIEDIVLPALEKVLTRDHVFRLTGSMEELAKLRQNIAENYIFNIQKEAILNGKEVPDKDTLMQLHMKELQKQGDKIWVSVRKDFFKNLDYYVDLVISGENKNIFATIGNAQAILGLLQDPTILQDAGKKTILFKVLSNLGMHTSELQDIEAKITEQSQAPMQPQPMQQLPITAPQNA
jgi:hypothetical protein